MTNKLSKKALFNSLIALIFSILMLGSIVFSMPIITEGVEVIDKWMNNWRSPVIACVAVVVLSTLIYTYLTVEYREVIAHPSKIIEVFLMGTVAFVLCFIIGEYIDLAARPLSLFALLCVTIFKRRNAIFLNCVFSIALLIIDRYFWCYTDAATIIGMSPSYASFLVSFCVGIIAIFSFRAIKTRAASVLLAFILIAPTLFIQAITQLPVLVERSWHYLLDLLLYSMLNCVLSVLAYFFLLPIFELLFSELTGFRLRELTSDSSKLVKRLKKNALGTYNHVVVVSQLVEACANAIGEDGELARAAAFYHDMGKLKNPEMFTENQSGDYDMHRELSPELSVDIIRSHTRDGAKLIRKHRLPEFLATVAVEHHGTLPIKYFYAKALKMSDGELNIENYSYSGPTPSSKISAIIMIADAAEAATRSLADRSPANVEALVRSLIEERIDLEQFVDCDITMRELTVIRGTIVSQLTGVYHSRVEYPKLTISKKK